MKYIIYQLKDIRNCDYGFMSWDFAKEYGFSINDYCEVYAGEEDGKYLLDKLFEKFNVNHPSDFKGHSMSVSDVVAVRGKKNWHWYYCDSFGWEEITDVVNSQTEKEPVLCGFVWCHGKRDFGVWEGNISPEDQAAIEAILEKYADTGTSERNCWDRKFSDVFCEEY